MVGTPFRLFASFKAPRRPPPGGVRFGGGAFGGEGGLVTFSLGGGAELAIRGFAPRLNFPNQFNGFAQLNAQSFAVCPGSKHFRSPNSPSIAAACPVQLTTQRKYPTTIGAIGTCPAVHRRARWARLRALPANRRNPSASDRRCGAVVG